MEAELEQETFNRIIYIVLGLLVILVIILITDIMTGGNLFSSLVCAMVWYLPLAGPDLTGYLGCHALAL